MEYQSLERNAKESHLKSLVELREFWSGVRANENVNVAARRIRKIADVAKKTDDIYESAVKRFPEARNIHILYARFLLKVVNDKEKAQMYQNNGENLENVISGDDRSEVEDAHANADKRSEGQSSRTSASKESKLQKQKRDLLYARLALPLQDFMRQIKLFSVIFLVLLIATVVVCKTSLDATRSSLSGLQNAMIPRRYTWKIYSGIRKIQAYAQKNDEVRFKAALANM